MEYDELTFNELNETIISLESEIERLTKIHKAAIDLVDGLNWMDIRAQTGMQEDRCKEILKIIRGEE